MADVFSMLLSDDAEIVSARPTNVSALRQYASKFYEICSALVMKS